MPRHCEKDTTRHYIDLAADEGDDNDDDTHISIESSDIEQVMQPKDLFWDLLCSVEVLSDDDDGRGKADSYDRWLARKPGGESPIYSPTWNDPHSTPSPSDQHWLHLAQHQLEEAQEKRKKREEKAAKKAEKQERRKPAKKRGLKAKKKAAQA